MNLDRLLDELGYALSQNYRAANETSHEPLTEHLFRAAKKAGVQGAYLFQTSPLDRQTLPPRPSVYVAEAKTREEARDIHQRLWNLGNAPFLVILLPNEIRVYTGFNFSLKNEKTGLIKEIKDVIDLTFDNIRSQLADFNADSIDSGKIWETQAKYITPQTRVDIHLLNNLKKLEEHLEGRGLELPIIHALIGKYVYIRYLCDRGILSNQWLAEHGLDLGNVLGRDATLDGLLHLTEVLDRRFDGAIFPLPDNIQAKLSDEIVSLVASTFKGDDPVSGQMHLESEDFKAYDFSYIPVETLSSIYEQFLHSQGTGKKVGAVYTPEPVADYLLCELEETKPLKSGMKILDPCCGSGIFLVLTYRRLIEIALAQSPNHKLKPTELREILRGSIFGIERNKEACYVAEFSLILTLLNYIDPPDLHRNQQFKFPKLHNQQIFECDFFDNDSDFWKQNKKFDWIVGNPPWIELKPKTVNEELARSWIKNNAKERPATGNRICEAFSWRVVDLLDSDGYVGLLIHANSLFNHESEKYRKAFFRDHAVARITNFSHLAYVLFGGRGEEPAATLIYNKAKFGIEKPSIIHHAPMILNQVANRPWKKKNNQTTWAITINENEISTISPEDAETGDLLLWKIALWGNFRDLKVLKRLQKLFPTTLGDLVKSKNWHCHQGLHIKQKNSGNEIESASYLSGCKTIDVNSRIIGFETSRITFRFAIPQSTLNLVPQDSFFVREGRSLPFVLAKAPHIIIKAASGDCIYSDIDFVIPTPQIGISADQTDAEYLRAVSVFLNSSLIRYFLFFKSPSWGVGRSRIYPKDLKSIPIPDLSDQQIIELSQLQKRLAYLEEFTNTSDASLQQLLDDAFEKLLSLPKNIGIITREFVSVKFQLNKGKSVVPATASPSEEHLHEYGLHLRDELDEFTEGSGLRHKVKLTYSKQFIVCSVEFIHSETSTSMDVTVEKKAQGDMSLFLIHIQEKAKQRFSQWVYVQRSLRIFENSRVYICKSPRLIDWTRTEALNDADDIISEILSTKSKYRLQEVV